MSMTKKGLSFVIFLAFLAVVGGMTMLGGAGSIIIYNILTAIQDWSELIALGIALGLFFYFMPGRKQMDV